MKAACARDACVGRRPRRWPALLVLYSALAGHALASAAADRLSFAEGAIPLRVEADPAAGVRIEQALRAIDGSDGLFVLTRPVPPDSRVSLYYELPAPTVFERFAVPRVAETPSPRQSFVREVEVWGSAQSPTAGFVKLASGTLAAHRRRGESTVLTLHDSTPVRWVRLDLRGVLDPAVPALTMEFSEIVGEGQAPAVPAASGFGGHWQGRGLVMSLQQQGTVVSGCYDRGNGRLQGTVSGRVMHATGSATKTGVLSVFVAVLQDDGTMQLLRSSNGAPFYHFTGNSATQGVKDCPQAEPPAPELRLADPRHPLRLRLGRDPAFVGAGAAGAARRTGGSVECPDRHRRPHLERGHRDAQPAPVGAARASGGRGADRPGSGTDATVGERRRPQRADRVQRRRGGPVTEPARGDPLPALSGDGARRSQRPAGDSWRGSR